MIDSERASEGAALGENTQAFARNCAALDINCYVLERRATENYLTEGAVKRVKGEKYGALGPYEKLKDIKPNWNKQENWRIAREMTLADLEGTDLGAFLEDLPRLNLRVKKRKSFRPGSSAGMLWGVKFQIQSRLKEDSVSRYLREEQKELLITLVEETRNLPREKRAPFYFVETDRGVVPSGRGEIRHQHTQRIPAYRRDIEALAVTGLLSTDYTPRDLLTFELTGHGFAYYEEIKEALGQPIQRIEATVRSYLNAEDFQRKYPKAYQKWSEAESLLWSSDSDQQFTTIGHLCREAIQEFAAALVQQHNPPTLTRTLLTPKIEFVLYLIFTGTNSALQRRLS